MPNIRWLLALVTTVHRFLYKASGGRIGARAGGVDVLLLKSTGRRTGRERETPLLYVREGDRYVVVASNAGDDRHPGWWLNLRERPETEIQVGQDRRAVRARRADEQEEAKLWTLLDQAYPAYADYRRRTARSIPVVVLDPLPELA